MRLRSNTSLVDFQQNDAARAGFHRLRLANVNDIITQPWQTDTETPILFKEIEKWLCDWEIGDFTNGQFDIKETITENGRTENYQLKVVFESGISQKEFKDWFDLTLYKQHLAIELMDENCRTRTFSPFEVSYEFLMPYDQGLTNTFQLLFQRVRLIEPTADKIKGIQLTCGNLKASLLKFIFLQGSAQPYTIGYSIHNDIETVANWSDAEIGLTNVPNGSYFGFSKAKNNSSFFTIPFKVNCTTTCTPIIGGVEWVSTTCIPAIGSVEWVSTTTCVPQIGGVEWVIEDKPTNLVELNFTDGLEDKTTNTAIDFTDGIEDKTTNTTINFTDATI